MTDPDSITWVVRRTSDGASALALGAVSERTMAKHANNDAHLHGTGPTVDHIRRPWGVAWDGGRMTADELQALRAALQRTALRNRQGTGLRVTSSALAKLAYDRRKQGA